MTSISMRSVFDTSILTVAHLVIGGSFLFIASNLLFASNLQLLPAIMLCTGCMGGFLVTLRTASNNDFLATPVQLRFFGACMATGFALNLLGGQGHIFYSTEDWLIRDSVLADLSSMPLPVYLWKEETWFLRAPVGMYMLPAALGRLAGLGAAHTLLLVQNACLTGCALYLIAEAFGRTTIIFIVLFVLFSGLDCVVFLNSYGLVKFPNHIEQWNPLFQYSSFVTQIFWVPNHALPGWWYAALVVLHIRAGGLVPILMVFFASALIWSPLAMMGALPFVLFLTLREPRKMWSPAVVKACMAGAAFFPIFIYLQIDADKVPSGWLISTSQFAQWYILFLVIEIPHAAFVALYALKQRPYWMEVVGIAIAMLLLIPIYWLGVSNDFAMRASIIPLVILGGSFAVRVIASYDDNDEFRFALTIIVLIGVVTPMVEIVRNVRMKPYSISPCDLISSSRELSFGEEGDKNHYIARAGHVPDWLIAPPQAVLPHLSATKSCWPDHPVLPKK